MKEQIKAGEPHRDLSWNEKSPLVSCWLGQRTGDKPLWGTGELMPCTALPVCLRFPQFFSFLIKAWRKTAAPGNVKQDLLFRQGSRRDRMGQDGTGGERGWAAAGLVLPGQGRGGTAPSSRVSPRNGQDPTGI